MNLTDRVGSPSILNPKGTMPAWSFINQRSMIAPKSYYGAARNDQLPVGTKFHQGMFYTHKLRV